MLSFLLLFASRQQEIEEKLIEEETARRVEELVAKRVEEELEKRKDEIEREVLRRVEEAKRIMEKQLLEELERQRQAELAAQKAREVTLGRLESRDSPWQNFQCGCASCSVQNGMECDCLVLSHPNIRGCER